MILKKTFLLKPKGFKGILTIKNEKGPKNV